MGSIWIIDDDEDIREVMTYALESEGHEVYGLDDAEEALNSLEELNLNDFPSLILVDYLMPKIDGLEFIHRFREKWGNRTAIALCSGMGSLDEEIPSGVIEINKPIELDELLHTAKLFTNSQRQDLVF